jgi:hypothetical protein
MYVNTSSVVVYHKDRPEWRAARIIRARHAGALGCESLTHLAREREITTGLCSWRQREATECKNGVSNGGEHQLVTHFIGSDIQARMGDRAVLGAVGNGRGGAPFIG